MFHGSLKDKDLEQKLAKNIAEFVNFIQILTAEKFIS